MERPARFFASAMRGEVLSKVQVSKYPVAKLLGLSPETVARMARRGEIPSKLVAGRYRFDLQEVEAWLEEQRVSVRAEGAR